MSLLQVDKTTTTTNPTSTVDEDGVEEAFNAALVQIPEAVMLITTTPEATSHMA
jgi:hypothetical protein